MDIWISMHNSQSQMANNIVKWWKTKFLNGYKQFSVECGDGKVSDTEELLGRLGGSEDDFNARLNASCTTPPLFPQETHSQNQSDNSTAAPASSASTKQQDAAGVGAAQHHLNFEEFSCDVSVENGDSKTATGQERQEFSFTLYDFDGHGKITKDDIAGLVTTIYEVLGSSVKVPHYGSKTIKVKLTVSPDQRKHVSATIINNKKDSHSDEKAQESSIRYKRDLNVTIRQENTRRNNRRETKQAAAATHKKHECCNKHLKSNEPVDLIDQLSDDSSDTSSRISDNLVATDEEDEAECSDNEKNHHNNTPNKVKSEKQKCHKNYPPRYTIPNLFMKDTNICNTNNCYKVKTLKKRSGSMQRQELLEIIQANMDKNNLSFPTPRKHSNSHVSPEEKQLSHLESHHKRVQKVATAPALQYLANIVDPTHFYVDLASLQNTTQLAQTHCQYDKLIDAVMCVSNKKISINKHPRCRKHRTKNNNFQYQLLHYPTTITNEEIKFNKSNKRSPNTKTNNNNNNNNNNYNNNNINSDLKHTHKNLPQFVTGYTSSPHHLRHRNRQEDQARAMEQVVRWLEQEFSSNLNTRKTKTKSNHIHKEKKTSSNNNSAPSTPKSGVERHEHHHVHEHIHHHYHHYQETPLVV